MLSRFVFQIRQCVLHVDYCIFKLFGRNQHPGAFCSLSIEDSHTIKNPQIPSYSLDSLLKDSILWAVPKHRRTVEKRLKRKFGWPDKVWKLIVPKKNLLLCNACGDHHEAGHLCPTCYSKVKTETEAMQAQIESELGVNPTEKEVVVLYQGEKEGVPDEFFKGKRIIEMKKERPSWFSKNLLEGTTKAPATTTSVKPTDLA